MTWTVTVFYIIAAIQIGLMFVLVWYEFTERERGCKALVYAGQEVELEVEEWYAEKKGFGTVYLTGEILMKTKKAILLRTEDRDENWIPLEVCAYINPYGEEG